MPALARATSVFCVIAAVVAFVALIAGTEQMSANDAGILAVLLAPYPIFALYARLARRQRVGTILIAVAAVVMAVWGIILLANDAYWFHADPNYRKTQRMSAFLVQIGQWSAVILAGLGILVGWWFGRSRPAGPGGP